MSDRELLKRIDADLQAAPRGVLYLEGKTDVPIFFGLLGVPWPLDDVLDGIGEHGLNARSSSGSSAVGRHVAVATERGRKGVYGIVDGDGRTVDDLAKSYDPPHRGPLFTWKTYSIENLLPLAGWPSRWGIAPVWEAIYRAYATYVALNVLHREAQRRMRTLDMGRFQDPDVARPLKTAAHVLDALTRDKALVSDFDVAKAFSDAHDAFVPTIPRPDEVHAAVNGKWFTRHFAVAHLKSCGRPNVPSDDAAAEWAEAIGASGGLLEVRTW